MCAGGGAPGSASAKSSFGPRDRGQDRSAASSQVPELAHTSPAHPARRLFAVWLAGPIGIIARFPGGWDIRRSAGRSDVEPGATAPMGGRLTADYVQRDHVGVAGMSVDPDVLGPAGSCQCLTRRTEIGGTCACPTPQVDALTEWLAPYQQHDGDLAVPGVDPGLGAAGPDAMRRHDAPPSSHEQPSPPGAARHESERRGQACRKRGRDRGAQHGPHGGQPGRCCKFVAPAPRRHEGVRAGYRPHRVLETSPGLTRAARAGRQRHPARLASGRDSSDTVIRPVPAQRSQARSSGPVPVPRQAGQLRRRSNRGSRYVLVNPACRVVICQPY
jgi:hypothetical protein